MIVMDFNQYYLLKFYDTEYGLNVYVLNFPFLIFCQFASMFLYYEASYY